MRIKSLMAAGLVAGITMAITTVGASAACVTKGATATSISEASAKWFVMETIVQQVSWGLWPGWVATGQLPGYKVKNRKYKCSTGSGTTKCTGRATICKVG